MSSPRNFNLIIPRGEDFSKTFQKRNQILIGENTTISTDPVSLLIYPLSAALSEGDKLQFAETDEYGNWVMSPIALTVEADALPGDTNLTLSASRTVDFELRQSLIGLPIDLAGYSGESKVRKQFNDTESLITISVDFPDRANGIYRIRATDSQTSVDANVEPDALPVDALIQDESAYDPKVWKRRYRWDLELTKDGVTSRDLQGACFVTAEATYAG